MISVVVAPPQRRSWLEWIVRGRELGLIIIIVAVVAAPTGIHSDYLFSPAGWRDLLREPAMLMVVAVGEAVVIITRNIDLSVGSVLGLSTYLSGLLLVKVPGVPIVVAFLVAIAFGTLLGLINGLLVAFLRVPSLVITLGTLYVYRGISVLWIGGNFIRKADLPQQFQEFGLSAVFSIPSVFILAVVVTVLAGWFMTSRRTGRDLYAIGSNPDAAVLFGMRTRGLTLLAFGVSGALAGLGGIIYLAIYSTGDSKVGSGLELQAVAAAVVGGVAIVGGSGRIWGVALGAFFLATLGTSLPVLGIPSLWQQAVVGVLIVGAITLDRLLFVIRSRRTIAEARR
jgi:rhamnose transport system permease protein